MAAIRGSVQGNRSSASVLFFLLIIFQVLGYTILYNSILADGACRDRSGAIVMGGPDGCSGGGGGGGDVGGVCETAVIPHGYKCQEYQVQTRDGYVLSMQRIPEGRRGSNGSARRPAVLLQHGVLMDGMTWLLNSPEQSLAFILADRGFDVWVANTRGTQWSHGHAWLDPRSKDYWKWSWDELALYDLPATVDLVYAQTGGKKMHYVGHSLGTLVALASFSEGRIVDKLLSAALLSPVAYLSHMTTPVGILAAKAFVAEITNWLGFAEFNPKGPIVGDLINGLCHKTGINCFDLVAIITGENCCLNGSTVDLFLKYEPQPTSTRTMVHFAQTFRDRAVTMYDYGNPVSNMLHYGRLRPPAYDLAKIPNDLPLFMSYGGRDSLSDSDDVAMLLTSLKSHDSAKLTVQFVRDFAHADFVMAVNARDVVYDAMVEFFNRW